MTTSPTAHPGRVIRPGQGLLVALVLLLGVEWSLHQDATLYRLRSVFAAGRAMDKVLYTERHVPELLVVGNSRADNAFDPSTVRTAMGSVAPGSAFNLGLPGADARVLYGILLRLAEKGLLGPEGIRTVVLSLDEALVQDVDNLGQDVFFADRWTLLTDWQLHDWLRSALRLYGYSDNLRQLREPGTLVRFARAIKENTAPVGGAAAAHGGYRAGIGALQDRDAALRQEAGSRRPPSASNLRNLWRIVDLLERKDVKLAVVFPPLLNRNVLYLEDDAIGSAPYGELYEALVRRKVPVIVLDRQVPRNPAEFVNSGHLNDRGAQRYSAMLGEALTAIWPTGTLR